jgi:hypothetical protein
MNSTQANLLPFSRRQLKMQGLLWLGIAAEISLMALLVREVRPGPLPPGSDLSYAETVAGAAFTDSAAPLLAQEIHCHQ